MLVDKYEPINLLELVPLERDRVLDKLDELLDDDELVSAIKADLAKRHPNTPSCGRRSTPVEVILRMLVVKHLYNWSYEETEHFVSDSIILRQFCRVYLERVPDDTTLIKWAGLIQPETLRRLLDRVVGIAHRLKVTRGRKLRTDGTVVESNIRYPTDSGLLVDGVRVLGRTLRRARQVVESATEDTVQVPKEVFRNRLRSARRTAREIGRITRRGVKKRSEQYHQAYQKMVKIAQASIRQAQQVRVLLQDVATPGAQKLCQLLDQFVPLVEQCVQQTVRRVIQEESVPASEKIVSVFEPHTDIIRRGKKRKSVEFGHKIWLDEVDGGIVSDYRLLEGNPSDSDQWKPSLQRHLALFGRPPYQASGDRGMYSPDNETLSQNMGVRRTILPKPGHRSEVRKKHEQQRWFRRGRRYHNGVEGRISVLKRRHGLDRCPYHGIRGFQTYIGWGILAHNLLAIGSRLASA